METRQTEAAILFEIGKPLRIMSLNIPTLKPGQVLVDVRFSGVCHSQLLEINGKRGPDRFIPHALGHEGSGVVLEVGPEVRKVKPGDHVVLSWIKGSGADVGSTVYLNSHDKINSGAVSTFMRRAVISENRVTPIDSDISLQTAALLGCAIPTGAGIVINALRLAAGQSLAVFGAGGIGLSAILAARMVKADPLIAVDIVDEKLAQAQRLGATHVVNPLRDNPAEAIRNMTKGRGVDGAIESAGKKETMELAFRSVRENGGVCVIAGNLAHGETISIDPFDLIKGRRIVGTWGGETMPDRDIPRYVEWIRKRELDMDALDVQIYPLQDINRSLADLAAGRIMRALIDMNKMSGVA